ncbi:MAG: DUF1934 family protein [Bacilli bacterium]|nr:DUF1934 family protein [Bacilli bacterium]
MAKIKINSILKTNNEVIKKEFMGIIMGNKIVYNDDLVTVTIFLKQNSIEMKRNNDSYSIDFEFINNKTTKCVYNVREQNMIIYLSVVTNKLIVDDNRFLIDYSLYQNDEEIESVLFEFEYEVI